MSFARLSLFGLAAALLAAPAGFAQEPAGEEPAKQAGPRVYLIGNSLTADTLPSRLDGTDAGLVQWHIYCGKNLTFIRENPDGHCVQSSTPWPQALAEGDYDFLSVQPHHGTTPAEDAAIIAEFAAQQPDAVVVLHTAWTHLAKFAAAYEANDADGPMQPSPAYFDAVLKKLRTALPGREIRTTNCYELLYALHEDIEAGRGPFKSLDDVGRDAIHMNHGPGRYLMHNAMRRALGQPPSAAGFELEPEVKAYLDEQLAAHGWRPLAK
ncbi:hypothetical protein [Alienimonas californiensis]|uniref:Trehalose utilization n=1 Tax=Alienimonas californiensis TaxID=2527989 RepID=A0A517P4V1_9PLAN|nr:hypothetical protein [Alienimonas californiensis]QDT14394.1 hypothetical protein CA12_04670 [Alienimonas californiensis]